MTLTCISCKVLFSVPELHHEHYKTDWHRYNLKRRIAELPPLTKDEFEARAAAFRAANEEKEKVSLKCDLCNKHFSSQNAMSTHLKSKKHLGAEAGGGAAAAVKKLKLNLESLKLPLGSRKAEEEELTAIILKDPPAKNNFEEEWAEVDDDDDSDWESCDGSGDEEDGITKIIIDTDDCLFCDYHSKSSSSNVKHMTKEHSFFIPDVEYVSDLDGLIAYLAGKVRVGQICLWCNGKGKAFKSVKSVRQHMFDKGHCKMLFEGEALVDYADFYDYSKSSAQQEDFDDEVISNLLEDSDFELVLPSGATVGHRSLAMYYKQNLKPLTTDNDKKIKKVLQHYKKLGYLGGTGQAASKKARDVVFVKRVKDRYNLKLGIKNNKLQPHFRSQVMF